MVNRRFLILFAVTVTLVVAAIRAGEVALGSGETLAEAALGLLGVLALSGLAALIRSVYIDGRDRARRDPRGSA